MSLYGTEWRKRGYGLWAEILFYLYRVNAIPILQVLFTALKYFPVPTKNIDQYIIGTYILIKFLLPSDNIGVPKPKK
jgi:hypothetical protein